MRINLITRPSALPAVCAPVSGAWALGLMAPGFPQLPQVHQVQAAQPAQTEAWIDGDYGISGFAVKDVSAVDKTKRDVRGVPPRGRPV
ncbi:hypothetical protein [Phytohabitans rumicis]|uniref:Uncharacterized protein n=1 Tax=Phytohabitans rumicis TaxID=1076125 RepID=A0A6V8L295_9ACTN|nr:hypothetical protein [Phytohabitans rumicis]GFJ91413.1 hypothetical protein Prum_050550 [Phytohabitans rumicis]